MAKQRKIRNEDDARACLALLEASGSDAGAWAREHGVDGRSLHAWRINLGRAGTKSARGGGKSRARRPRLVELVPAAATRSARYVVRMGDVEVELDDAFREETLRRLVMVLRAC